MTRMRSLTEETLTKGGRRSNRKLVYPRMIGPRGSPHSTPHVDSVIVIMGFREWTRGICSTLYPANHVRCVAIAGRLIWTTDDRRHRDHRSGRPPICYKWTIEEVDIAYPTLAYSDVHEPHLNKRSVGMAHEFRCLTVTDGHRMGPGRQQSKDRLNETE